VPLALLDEARNSLMIPWRAFPDQAQQGAARASGRNVFVGLVALSLVALLSGALSSSVRAAAVGSVAADDGDPRKHEESSRSLHAGDENGGAERAGRSPLSLDTPQPTLDSPSNQVERASVSTDGGQTTLEVQYSYEVTDPDKTTITIQDGSGSVEWVIDDQASGLTTVSRTITLDLETPANTTTPDGAVTSTQVTGDGLDSGTYDIDVSATAQDGDGGNNIFSDRLVIDNTAPTVSNVNLENDGNGNLAFSFDTNEQLGGSASDISVTVDGPNTTDVYSFDRNNFGEKENGASFT